MKKIEGDIYFKLPPEAELLLAIAKDNGCNRAGDLIKEGNINWQRFKDLIIYHELHPFVHLLLKEFSSFVPPDLAEFLKNNYYCALARCQNIWQEFLRISAVFEEAGISILPLKGVALLSDLYREKPIRPMTDMDVLIKDEDFLRAEEIFCGLGYRKDLWGLKEEYWRKKQTHVAFYKKEKSALPFVEVHWAIDFKRGNRPVLAELWGRVRTVDAGAGKILLLSAEDTLFSLALHNRRYGKPLCLKNAYDAVLLLEKYKGSFDWDYCLKMSKKYKLYATLYFILCQAGLFSSVDIPEHIWGRLNISVWKKRLIQRFIVKNTFLADNKNGKDLYLKSHFLLYDNLWEPINYIVNIPKEQFAKYYGLAPYGKKTDFLYKIRLFYILFKAMSSVIANRRSRIENIAPQTSKMNPENKYKERTDAGEISLFDAAGFSMWPFLQTKDKLIVKKTAIADLRVGDIILYRADNQLVCHRLIKKIRDKGGYLLYARGDNSSISREAVTEEMFSAKAVGIIRNGRTINLSTKSQQLINRVIVVIAPLVSRAVRIAVKLRQVIRDGK